MVLNILQCKKQSPAKKKELSGPKLTINCVKAEKLYSRSCPSKNAHALLQSSPLFLQGMIKEKLSHVLGPRNRSQMFGDGEPP